MAPCPLWGKEPSQLKFFSWEMLRDSVLVRSGSSTVSLALHHPQLPYPLLLNSWNCSMQRRTKPPPQPRPWAHQPPAERCLLLAVVIHRTAWGEAPTRVHGCPLVAARGKWNPGIPGPCPLGGAFNSGLSGQHFQSRTFSPRSIRNSAISHRARGRSQLGKLTAGSIGQGPWKK